LGSGSAEESDVAMNKWFSDFSVADIVSRARSWVGRPASHVSWSPAPSCVHLMAYVYGWSGGIPEGWQNYPLEYLIEISGWGKVPGPGEPGEIALFKIRNRPHIGIYTTPDTIVHAGTRVFAESLLAPYIARGFFEGVLTWR